MRSDSSAWCQGRNDFGQLGDGTFANRPVFGPIVGSMVAEVYDWRSAFFIIVPPGIAAMGCVWFALREYTERIYSRFDWTGFIALSTAITAAQLMMDRGQRLDWFESTEIVLCAVVAVLAASSTVGGLLGASIGKRLPPAVLRGVIVVIGMIAVVFLLVD